MGELIYDTSNPADRDDWKPPVGFLSKHERETLSETAQRTLARNRLGFYELFCGNCAQFAVVHRIHLPDLGEVWLCPDCRE
jgi:hypothetical protein